MEERNPAYSNRWLTTIIINDSNKIDPEIIRLHLVKHNIESRRLWKPMHTQPVFKEFQFYGGDTSESLFKKGLCLPSGSSLSNNQLDYIINVIKELYEA